MPTARISAGALPLLSRAQKIAVICHANPDADCVGGMMALVNQFRDMGRTATAVSPDPMPEILRHVPGASGIVVAPFRVGMVDALVSVDAAAAERIEPVASSNRDLFGAVPLLNIDHHASNPGFGAEQIIDPSAASVCELLFSVFLDLKWDISPVVARCLLTGVISDTRGFRTLNTTAHSLKVAGDLIERGAPLTAVSDSVHKYRRANQLPVWADVLARSRHENGLLWSHLREDEALQRGIPLAELDGIVGFLADTRDASVAVLFTVHTDGRVRVSLRSDGSVDVSAIAAKWGGGGHRPAAGCTIKSTTFESASADVLGAVTSAIQDSTKA
ncbi:MAG: hypothetical protein EPO26_00680 [Chloroflexota bacterium]|nr:MAG: hypothetical protein EPO26_00680 [Chloroflexota bacterium]